MQDVSLQEAKSDKKCYILCQPTGYYGRLNW